MSRKTTTFIGAAAALMAGSALAAPVAVEPAIPAASSYADLLQPIPDAVERLKRADAEAAARRPEIVPVQLVVVQDHHHHHHHHHHHARAWYLAHGYYWHGGAWVVRPVHHHHHDE
jgi:hypothetical protein